MSGHSKWANIKHKKEKTDAQKAKVFTKIGKEITIAVKRAAETLTPMQSSATLSQRQNPTTFLTITSKEPSKRRWAAPVKTTKR